MRGRVLVRALRFHAWLGLRACLRRGLGLGGRLAWLARARRALGLGIHLALSHPSALFVRCFSSRITRIPEPPRRRALYCSRSPRTPCQTTRLYSCKCEPTITARETRRRLTAIH